MSEWGEPIPASALKPFNIGLHAAREETLIALLGKPLGVPDNKACYNDKATPQTKALLVTENVGPFRVHGIRPAVRSLTRVFASAGAALPAGYLKAIGSAGMLCVRKRRPTSGQPTDKLSSHSWGSAIDISVDGHADTAPDGEVQKGIAVLIPFMNAEGWYSGVAFKDDTHFEVAEETLHAWAAAGAFEP